VVQRESTDLRPDSKTARLFNRQGVNKSHLIRMPRNTNFGAP